MATLLELALLTNIVESEYQRDEDPVDCPVWSSGDYLTGGAINARNIGGVMASLAKKGFIRTDGRGQEATVAVTRAGYEALRAAREGGR